MLDTPICPPSNRPWRCNPFLRRLIRAPPREGLSLSREVVHIRDIASDPEYSAASIVKAGFRSALSVPMLRNGEPIGAINVTRLAARPFSDRQVELLKIFADQAVIAINNVGLFNETQEALEHQKATSDILQVISRSTFDLDSVSAPWSKTRFASAAPGPG